MNTKVSDLTPAQLRRTLAREGLYIQTGPFVLRMRSGLASVGEGITLLYGDFPLAPPVFADFHGELVRPRGPRRWFHPQVWFHFDGRRPFKPLPLDQAMPMFEWCMNWCVASHSHQYMVIHAAVIEKDGRAVVMPGVPGAGKSTLCAGLVNRGWRLLSDELCLVRLGDGRIMPLPRPVSLKNESIDVIRGYVAGAVLGRVSHDTIKGTVAHLRPPAESVRRADEPATPAWIIFPRYDKNAAATLTPAAKATAFMRVADHAFNYSLLGAAGFEAMRRLVNSCDCYDFTYSQLDDAVKVFADLAVPPVVSSAASPPAWVSPKIDVIPEGPRTPARERRTLLLKVLRDPSVVAGFALGDWDLLIRQGRHGLLLARLAVVLDDLDLLGHAPQAAQVHLLAARRHAAKHERTLRWEVNRITHALAGVGVPLVLLKGAAYVMAGLPPARGRVVSDTDILVPKEKIDAVENALRLHGWDPTDLDAYDQRYYRTWMHEIPPLRHRQRESVIDVHHNILPETASLHPDPRKLLAASVPLNGDENLRVLAPADMVLHSATHLFHDGELEHGLRDLVDLDQLLRHFGARPDFWKELTARAGELGLGPPLHYALRYTEELLGTPGPETARIAALRGAPSDPALMDALFRRALMPDHASCNDWFTPTARWMLYVRSHYLRMPPHLLLPHLVRKAIRRRFPKE